jgi:aminocarboxymuconate-semialdehyde decarboxylase
VKAIPHSRRGFLKVGCCAAAVMKPVAGLARTAETRAPAAASAIDIHAHYFPLEYLKTIADRGGPNGFTVDFSTAGGPTLTGGGAVTVLDETYWRLETRLQRMDEAGVRLHALSLTMPMVHSAPPERAADLARLVNDAMVAAHAKYPDRFVGCATLPLQDTGLAVAELERVSKLEGIRGVYFPTNINGKELSDPSLDPVYDRCQALNLPVLLHPHPPVVGLDRMKRFYLPNLLGNPFDTTVACSYLIFGGVLDRYPTLNIVLPHSGGALPFIYGRIQRGQGVIRDLKTAARRPVAEYLKRFFYDTITHSQEALKYLVDLVGPERVMLGSDYCFNMGYDRPREIVAALNIRPAEREMIISRNAAQLLGV